MATDDDDDNDDDDEYEEEEEEEEGNDHDDNAIRPTILSILPTCSGSPILARSSIRFPVTNEGGSRRYRTL